MRLFRSLTLGQTVIMGRKTFESIGKPLAGRRCWVLSHHISPPPLRTFSSTHSLLESIGEAAYGEEFWLIGGAEIYRQLVPYCCEIVQTLLEESYGGDVFWRIPEDFTAVSSLLTNEQFTTYRLRRKSVAPLAFSAQC
jgi:dihydrofolate reductase